MFGFELVFYEPIQSDVSMPVSTFKINLVTEVCIHRNAESNF